MEDAAPQKPYRDERYEFNAPMWHAFPGPGEDGDGSHDSDSVSQYFSDPKATAALLTPNARQNVVTVRRRTGPNGRSSGLISPQPLKAAKRLRMEPGDENAPPAGTPASAAKKHKASNIRTSWGGAAGRRLQSGAAGSTRAQASGAKGNQRKRGSPALWPPPPKRDALRHVGSPRSRGAAAAAAAAAKVAPATAAKASITAAAAEGTTAAAPAATSISPVQPSSGGRTRNQRAAAAAAAERAAAATPASTSSAGAAAAAGEAAPTAGEAAAAQRSAPRQPQAVAVETGREPEVQQLKVQPAKTPRPRKRPAPGGPPAPASEVLNPKHRDFCHVTRSVARALSPAAAAAAAARSGPKTPPAAPVHAAAPANVAAGAPEAAAAPMTSGHKRSLRLHTSGSPDGGRSADPIDTTAAAKPPAAAAAAAEQPAAAAATGPAAADADGMLLQAAKRRARPRKSGLHAGAAARIPSAAVDAEHVDVGKLSASVMAVGAAAAVMSAKAYSSAAIAGGSPLPAPLQVPTVSAFRAAAAAAAAAPAAAVRRDGKPPASGARAAAAPLADVAQPRAQRTAQHRASARLRALTVPHSPMLHSKLRYRPPNPDMTTEELRLQQSRAEAEEAARLRALNAVTASRVLRAMPRLPERRPRPATVAHTPPLRTARRPRSNDVTLRPQVEEPSVAEQLAAFEAGRGLPSGAAHTVASLRGSAGPPQLTHPQSPALRTSARLRPPRFLPTEEAEAAAVAALPPFAARPLSRTMLEGGAGQGLPTVPPRPLTDFEPFHLSETNAAPAAAAEEPPFVFSARPVPATVHRPAAPPRPPRAPLTQPQPFALSTDARAPRRAAALAAEQAARRALTSFRAKARVSSGAAGPQPPQPPTQAASPKLSLTSRAADRARFDEELARKAEQAEAEQRAAAAAQAEREADELAAYRRTLQFKARPAPSAGDSAPGPGPAPRQPLTVPQSPYLNTRSRAAKRGF